MSGAALPTSNELERNESLKCIEKQCIPHMRWNTMHFSTAVESNAFRKCGGEQLCKCKPLIPCGTQHHKANCLQVSKLVGLNHNLRKAIWQMMHACVVCSHGTSEFDHMSLQTVQEFTMGKLLIMSTAPNTLSTAVCAPSFGVPFSNPSFLFFRNL